MNLIYIIIIIYCNYNIIYEFNNTILVQLIQFLFNSAKVRFMWSHQKQIFFQA